MSFGSSAENDFQHPCGGSCTGSPKGIMNWGVLESGKSKNLQKPSFSLIGSYGIIQLYTHQQPASLGFPNNQPSILRERMDRWTWMRDGEPHAEVPAVKVTKAEGRLERVIPKGAVDKGFKFPFCVLMCLGWILELHAECW